MATVPISTFICLWASYTFPPSICLFFCRKYVDWSWEYVNLSQTHECVNWDWSRAIPRKGIHKWDFRCSVAWQFFSWSLSAKWVEAAWVSFTILILSGSNAQRMHLFTGARNQRKSQSSKERMYISWRKLSGGRWCGGIAVFVWQCSQFPLRTQWYAATPKNDAKRWPVLYAVSFLFGSNNRMNCHVANPLPFQPAREWIFSFLKLNTFRHGQRGKLHH